MKDVVLFLYFRDTDYGRRLLRYIAGKKNPFLYPELLTSKERLEVKEVSGEREPVVLTDDAGLEENSKRKVICLSKKKDGKKDSIYRYQKASGIYRDLLEMLGLTMAAEETDFNAQGIRQGIFYLMNPNEGGSEALLLSQYLGKKGKCLYLDLKSFPVFYNGELNCPPEFTEKGLDRLMFGAEGEKFEKRVKELVRPFGKAEMIPPFPHYRDLLDSRLEEWKNVLCRLCRDCGYDSIIMDADALYEYSLDLMCQSDYPVFIRKTDLCGSIRFAVFERYCRMEGKTELIERCRVLPLLSEGEETVFSQNMLEEIAEDTEKMRRIEEWFTHSREEEENDCIIECEEGTDT